MPLRGPGQLGDARPGRQAQGHWLAGRLTPTSVVQQPGLVRRLPFARRRRPSGVMTGFGFSSASTADQQVAETFFAVRAARTQAHERGFGALGPYVVDKGFEGAENHLRWLDHYGARLICPPKRNAREVWPKRLRRWVAGIRQIVESVYDKLFNAFGLWRERPHELQGLRARLAARVALHNFWIWLNEQLGRPRLAFADLLGW